MSDDSKPSKLCRICLTSDVKMYMSIFEKYREFTINDYILLLTNVDIKQEDGFPEKICATCYMDFETALNFKQKCENSDNFLKSSREQIIEACANAYLEEIIIVKKEEPYEANVEFEEAPEESTVEYYGVEVLDDAELHEQNNVKPSVSRAPRALNIQLECHDCGTLFKSKCKLRVHWHKMHKLAPIVCDICKRLFKTYKAYHTHRLKPTKSCKTVATGLVKVEGQGKLRMFHCKQCNYKSIRIKDLATHILIHSGDRPFECKICQKNYTQQSSLQSHMESKHKKYLKEITCHICGKHVLGRVKAYRHMQRHTEAKYPCPVCQKMFNNRNLKQHMLRHSNTKSFTCEKCASTFYTLAELCNHRRWVHNKQRNAFKCDLCSYTASRKQRIKVHRGNHTDSNVPCMVCGMFFPNVQKMESHKKQHFADKTFECSYCDRKFYRPDSLRKHIMSKHKQVAQASKERKISATNKAKHSEDDNYFKIKIGKLFKKEGG